MTIERWDRPAGTRARPEPATFGRCPTCGKVRYRGRRFAKTVAKRLGRRMSAYKCGDFYHVGHLPADVRKGQIGRGDLKPRKADREAKRPTPGQP